MSRGMRLTCADRESNKGIGITYMAEAEHKVEQSEKCSKKGAGNREVNRQKGSYRAKKILSSSGCDFIQPCAMVVPC